MEKKGKEKRYKAITTDEQAIELLGDPNLCERGQVVTAELAFTVICASAKLYDTLPMDSALPISRKLTSSKAIKALLNVLKVGPQLTSTPFRELCNSKRSMSDCPMGLFVINMEISVLESQSDPDKPVESLWESAFGQLVIVLVTTMLQNTDKISIFLDQGGPKSLVKLMKVHPKWDTFYYQVCYSLAPLGHPAGGVHVESGRLLRSYARSGLYALALSRYVFNVIIAFTEVLLLLLLLLFDVLWPTSAFFRRLQDTKMAESSQLVQSYFIRAPEELPMGGRDRKKSMSVSAETITTTQQCNNNKNNNNNNIKQLKNQHNSSSKTKQHNTTANTSKTNTTEEAKPIEHIVIKEPTTTAKPNNTTTKNQLQQNNNNNNNNNNNKEPTTTHNTPHNTQHTTVESYIVVNGS